MDDNELDRLFGEVSEAAQKPENEPSKDKEKEPSDKEAGDSERAEEILRKNGFIVKQYKESSEEDDEEQEESSEDEETEDSENTENTDDAADPEGSDEEDGESSEDEYQEEDTEEGSAEESDEESDEEEESPSKAKKPKKPKKKPSRRLSKKGITIICLFVLILGLVALIWFLPAFRVRNVHVEGNVSQTDQDILRQLKLEYNSHLMGGVSGNILDVIRLDYGKTEERIKREPLTVIRLPQWQPGRALPQSL